MQTAFGECRGVIAWGPAGEHGFGYDPVFYMPEHDATMAQLPPDVKNRVSHRARAAAAAVDLIGQMTRQPDDPGSGTPGPRGAGLES